MESIIKVEKLSKQYRLGVVGTGTIKDDLKRWWYRARGKEDPFLKLETPVRVRKELVLEAAQPMKRIITIPDTRFPHLLYAELPYELPNKLRRFFFHTRFAFLRLHYNDGTS